MYATHGREEEGGEGRWERAVGRFDMELHIIKPAPVFMVESHPPGCVPIPHSCILSRSLLLSTRDTGLLNLETLYLRPRLHTYTHTCRTRIVGWLRRRELRMAQIYCVL